MNIGLLIQLLTISVLLSLIAGYTSTYASISRSEFLVVTISHAVLAGLAILLYISNMLHINVSELHMWITSLLVAILTCAALTSIREHEEKELIVALVFALTLSIAALFMALLPGYMIARMWSFLTGNILLTTPEDMFMLFIICLVCCTLYTFYYREFILVSYDMEYALSTGISARAILYLLSILISIAVLACVYIVGLFVSYAILMIPGTVLAKARFRIREMIITSTVTVFIALLLSTLIALKTNVPPSGLCGICICILTSLTFIIRIIAERRSP